MVASCSNPLLMNKMKTEIQKEKTRYRIDGSAKTYKTIEEATQAKVIAVKKTIEGVDQKKLNELLKRQPVS